MDSKSEAKVRVTKLIEKYERLTPQRKKSYSEADTRRDFIMPLFNALGWDVYNDLTENEVVEEETSISGRIDYSFRLSNITQFVLEAKSIPEDLYKEQWAKQAVEYGWNKGIPWVVLTDFEGLKVFNSEWKKDHPQPSIDLRYKEYLDKFDRLWLLSKESFEKNELDSKASEWGITAKRESVNERLAKDLLGWRGVLTKYFSQWNKKINLRDIEESVQRILDRLIFIRVVEDKDIEEKRLWQTFKQWESKDYDPQNFIEKLVPIFREFDKKYNSNLFEKHLCEDLYTTQEPFKKILPELYGSKEAGVKYRFDAINADVLGSVYEQYLGYIQGREGEKSKRKKQGIYYTPTYIVDYIVQNTLGKLLEEKSLTQIENVKVLDPACGSGSFLIKAFNVLNEKIKKERGNKDGIQAALRKYRILTSNIYGVDLDSQAVEIARLNLLLQALEPNHKLPMLNENIKNGNSLIEDKSVADKAFNWKSEFPSVFKNGGLDVIIGNPPYVFTREGGFTEREKDYFKNNYTNRITLENKNKALQSGKLNLFTLFLLRSADLLKKGGKLGFIIPNTFLRVNTYIALRKYLLQNFKILKIIDVGAKVFQGVTASTVVIILEKELEENKRDKNQIEIVNWQRLEKIESFRVVQLDFIKNNNYIFNTLIDRKGDKLLRKIDDKCTPLGDIAQSYNGIATKRDKSKYIFAEKRNSSYKPLIEGKDIGLYSINFNNKYILYDRRKLHRPRNEKIFLSPEKIVTQRIGGGTRVITAALDHKQYYTFNSVNNIIKQNKNFSNKYILALLNSNLLNWYYVTKFTNKSLLTVNISKTNLEQLPIKNPNDKEQKKIIDLVVQLQNTKEKMLKIGSKTDEWNEMKEKSKKLIKMIDQEVYKLYGLTSGEIAIVEKSSVR